MIVSKTILITGGAGFIGSNLCEYFLQKQNRVVCFDNLSTGYKKNIEPFLSNQNFTWIEGDIRNLQECENATAGVDFVLHQAALGSVPRSILDPITTNDVNVSGFLNMLVAARNAGVKRFVYASSSSVYGDSKILPKVENQIGKPLSPYAISKFANELYAETFSKIYGLETVGLRYFNVFGKNQDPNGAYSAVIPKFIKQFIDLEAPIINGDGNFSRDFTYIKNVLQVNELALEAKNQSAINTVYNTAFGQSTTLNEMVALLKEYLVTFDAEIRKVNPIFESERKGDIPHSLADISKAKVALGYDPKFDFKQGLNETISWYWKTLKNENNII